MILSKSTTEQIVKDYAKLTGQAKRKRPAFMAPQPVTLTMFHLDSQNPIHILNEYAELQKKQMVNGIYFTSTNRNEAIYSIQNWVSSIRVVNFPNVTVNGYLTENTFVVIKTAILFNCI